MLNRRQPRRHELSGRRRTVLFSPSVAEARFGELYPHMLIEDVGSRVMPAGRRWSSRQFAVALEPASGRIERLLVDALDPGGYEGLTEACCDFMRGCARALMTYGRAVYEIVYLRDEAGDVASMQFAYIPPTSVEVQHGVVRQYVPPGVVAERKVPAIISIPRSDVILFRAPLHEGMVLRMLDSLGDVDRPELPDFVQQEMTGQGSVGYSTSEDIRCKNLATAEVCREIGWDARGLFAEQFSEYYLIVRRLRFERFMARLRGTMLTSLNDALAAIADVTGESGTLTVSGMPVEQDVELAERSLADGSSDLTKILAPFA